MRFEVLFFILVHTLETIGSLTAMDILFCLHMHTIPQSRHTHKKTADDAWWVEMTTCSVLKGGRAGEGEASKGFVSLLQHG
ncbi:hypothetical protein DM02DRAFT_324540 [Periconia macrospinosa]|uniref:Uncharacterized protein n=1 Tax=Periconia macrospinosa TaxID=97972 RepID=A0A2V1EDE4_9PLEO|nr:hypothetical protein DM02DRAFT_324540 [Periconia macrospinosa]